MAVVLPVAVRNRVTVRCTGVLTSTFAGGGGTKVFCSQAVSVKSANAASKTRGAVCALHLKMAIGAVCNIGHAGFIQTPRLKFERKQKARPRYVNSNNPLAAELKSENDGCRRLFQENFDCILVAGAGSATGNDKIP